MQHDFEESDDDRVAQRVNGAGQMVEVNEVIPADPFLVAKQSLGGDELFKGDDEAGHGHVHVDEYQDHGR